MCKIYWLIMGANANAFYIFHFNYRMGHGHHEPFKIPHYTIYNNYQQFPQLASHEKRLAQIGLKDPWIRNYVYLYDRHFVHVQGQWAHFKKLILPGWKAGVAFSAALIAIEEGIQYAKYGTTSWDAHH